MSGSRPSGQVTVEANVLDGHPDLYGEFVRLTIGKMIRAERKFGSAEELKAQIERDREAAKRFFSGQ